VLLAMSVASWYLIIAKAVQAIVTRRRSERFLDKFWNSASSDRRDANWKGHPTSRSRISLARIVAALHHQIHGADKLDLAGGGAEFLTAHPRVIDEETARLESG